MDVGIDEEVSSRPDHLDYRHENELIELEHLQLQSRPGRAKGDHNYVGLALSGGGIRSASFSLGVMQAMASKKKDGVKKDVLKHVDYLSTVSGGGYIGSSLTWFLHRKWKDFNSTLREFDFGVEPNNFPFGTSPNKHQQEFSAGSTEKMSIMRHLRQNINYLLPGDGLGIPALFAALMRGIVINTLFYGPVLILTLISLASVAFYLWPAILELKQAIPWLFYMPEWAEGNSLQLLADNKPRSTVDYINFPNMGYLYVYFLLSLVPSVLALLLSVFYGLAATMGRYFPNLLYWGSRCYLKFTGKLWVSSLVLILIGSLPLIPHFAGDIGKLISGAGITIGGVLSALWAYLRSSENPQEKPVVPMGIIVNMASLLLVYGSLLLSYLIADYLLENSLSYSLQDLLLYLFGVVIALAFIGMLVNINYVTLHRYYRDRLMELFMPVPNKATIDQPAQPANEANQTYLWQMCNFADGVDGPYHLINANVMLPGSQITKFSGRGGDNFLLSPLYCGSSATGWMRTDRYFKGKLTLPTAMAISGAAVNPNTAACGDGATRNTWLSAIMAYLNLRLGVWIENPNPIYACKWFQPNLWHPGLRDILQPHNIHEKTQYVELSDGGHFENLAAYELIRREVKLIIICDAAADKHYTFSDFANLVEKVRLDFGAQIEINLDPLIPKPLDNGEYGLKELAERGHAFGNITYRSGEKGFLVYLKTTMTAGLPADIYGYKRKNENFPDESTGDQVFDEKQFEAYRELGFQLATRMLEAMPGYIEQLLRDPAQNHEWVLIRFDLLDQ